MKSLRSLRVVAIIGISVSMLGVGLIAPSSVMAGQYYEIANSGAGGNTGNAASFTTWSSWSIPESPSDPCDDVSGGYCAGGHGSSGVSDEAVWLIDTNNSNEAVEVGFLTGYAPLGNNAGWTTGLEPYYTIDDGTQENNSGSAYYLAADTNYWMAQITNGSTSTIQVNNWEGPFSYTLSTPRQDHVQGETLYGDDWMGGGAGTQLDMYYQPASDYPSGWVNWGEFTSCGGDDLSTTGEPFDYSASCGNGGTTYLWTFGGYGNGVFGS